MTRRIVQAPQLSSLHLEVREGLGLDARGVFENEWFSGEFERNLQGMSLTGCMVADSSLDGTDLSSSTFTECELTGLDAPGWRMARTVLRDVEVADSRFGAADFAEADLFSVKFSGCKFAWTNHSGGTLRDVLFEDCVFDEVDLSQAQAQRVAFRGCRARTLRVDAARMKDVDFRGLDFDAISGVGSLKGAVLTNTQAIHLAPAMAAFLGAIVD
ncbi:pentapeptide repeat-containing protein [Corynebacterium striatum]|uniref:pentapeptide repeat-containing protein n=1 Tax=Corynebacterium striatum TaxID=43770 RepID=UPI00069A0287|nr:pentapeptide repeat-containing protein [Corynebacterium striatum]MDK8843332.1 pentapeptide repeat-containing protein [Corynebacterium striatum]